MTIKTVTCALLTFAFSLPALSLAGDTTTRQMAEIILDLEEKPDPATQDQLKKIVRYIGSTTNEQTLAEAILNLDRKIRPEDKPKLMRLMLNPTASPNERDLAKALLHFESRPDDSVTTVLNDVVK